MKYASLFLCILFFGFVAVQYNDPDPYVWMPIYGFASVMCWLSFKGKYHTPILLTSAVLYFLGGLYHFPSDIMQYIQAELSQKSMAMNVLGVEEAREAFGLMIAGIAMLFLYVLARKKKIQEISGKKVVRVNEAEMI
ncbi:MAG: transmembrane 220 family protein [Cytophagaceae bacterium]